MTRSASINGTYAENTEDDVESVSIEFDSSAPVCIRCGEPIDTDAVPVVHEDGLRHCGYIEEHEADEDDPVATMPDQTAPDAWCNGAGVTVKGDSVQVWISTGDPRGAFTMEIRRTEDGRMYLHHPYPGEGMPHEDTTLVSPGTLIIDRTMTAETRAMLAGKES